MTRHSRPSFTVALQSFRAAAVCSLVTFGCRTQPYVNAHIESVNAEYRALEDYVYALEEENARLHQELELLRQQGSDRGGGSPASPEGLPKGRAQRRPGNPANEPRQRSEPSLEPPTIEIPETPAPAARPESSSGMIFGPTAPPDDTPPDWFVVRSHLSLVSNEVTAEKEKPTSDPSAEAAIMRVVLNPLFSRGIDLDGRPGDDGLRVVVEPRSAAGEYVPQAGAVSIVALDPSREGEAARVARWDFSRAQIEQLLKAKPLNVGHEPGGSSSPATTPPRGITLDLPWPAASPASQRLRVYVRYETPDGRRLQTDGNVEITLPGQSRGWTPRAATSDTPARSSGPAPNSPSAET